MGSLICETMNTKCRFTTEALWNNSIVDRFTTSSTGHVIALKQNLFRHASLEWIEHNTTTKQVIDCRLVPSVLAAPNKGNLLGFFIAKARQRFTSFKINDSRWNMHVV